MRRRDLPHSLPSDLDRRPLRARQGDRMGTIVARRPGTAERIRPPADTSASLRRLTADPAHGPLPALLLAMTVLVGVVDAVSILSLGRVFVANMTGNVVFIGFALAGASGFSLSASLSALGGFLVGAGLGGVAVDRLGTHRGRLVTAVVGGELVLLLVALLAAALAGAHLGEGSRD